MPPPPPPSGVSRAQSLRKPAATTTGQSSRTASLRAPLKNSAPSAIARSASTAQSGAGALSRTSRPGSSSSNTSSQTATPRTIQTERSRAATLTSAPSSRMPAPASDLKRGGSTISSHSRSRSELTAPRNPASTTITRRGAETQEKESKLTARPAFSTLQQHYSPKKTLEPKKSTSALLNSAPTSSVPTDPFSAEIMALQAELLQLHLLCESSSETQAKWERSAEKALRLQFYEVATAHHNMCKNESEVQELINLHALEEWSSGNAAFGLAENIQVLGPLLNELRALTDSGGRYTHVVQGFEKWIDWVEEIWRTRGASQSLDVAEGLGEAWKGEVAALQRKVTLLDRDVDRLLEPAEGSTIRVVVNGCRSLVKGMAHELQLMRRIEVEVGEGEAQWVERGLEGIAQKIDTGLQEPHGVEASWRAV
ncbi:uncharacterized protein K452DRAFT_287600 [Aplosporella prunicola CBS 121167]|uniref:Uncharacterized protein n=1 Tax=Aplosporella prunicola CBS 121167 TaxID=1176127 RepID=A0A6A6BDH4_9PEZI|nr:uncharacterized protein K452DRAFT_287600 [Aplosporella prunicola CBS 121167]KAF2141648.1 hypothetical protein K452DRAFT_287600 [Aplosporella prunicola CBS 121167]